MENTRTNILKQIIDFCKSFSNSGYVNNGKVTVEDLDKEERKKLDEVVKASGGNVKKMEDSMSKYRTKIDTTKAKKAASLQNDKRVKAKEDKTRDNN